MNKDRTSFTLQDVFSRTELDKIKQIFEQENEHEVLFHIRMREEIVTEKKLAELKTKGYEFDRDYLVYAIEYAISRT